MKNKSPNTIQLAVGQNKPSTGMLKQSTVQVNSWVNTALNKKTNPTPTNGLSQMVEVHFAFSKSILNRR